MSEIYILKNKNYSNLLLYSSNLFFINSILALIYNLYDYGFISFCIYLNSINYWRKPTFSLRRNIDITTCILSFIYHKYNLIYIKFDILSFIFLYFGIIFYIFGIFLSRYKKIYISVICHIFLHIFTSMSCIVYYINYF